MFRSRDTISMRIDPGRFLTGSDGDRAEVFLTGERCCHPGRAAVAAAIARRAAPRVTP